MIEKAANAATATSLTSWAASLAFANEVASLIASLVAIAAGLFAIAVYARKLRARE